MITHTEYPEHIAFAWAEGPDPTHPITENAPSVLVGAPTHTGGTMDATKHQMAVYAILDTIADQIIGGLVHHKHDAAAVRFYSDVASMKDSLVGKHPQDFDLIRLGYVTHHHELEPDNAIILKGSMWAAAQNHETPLQLEA